MAGTSGRRRKRSISYFLLSLLEDDSYPHVQWTNKERGEFQIHWMHASSGAWTMKTDAETFRLWAQAKGKLKEGDDRYKTWKANFRCAMKSRDELEEIKLPGSSLYKKKNLKFWRFKDMKLVNNYKDGESFDWSRSSQSSRKPTRVLRRRRKRIADLDETSESEENESQQPFCEAQGSSAQGVVPSDSRLQANYENQQLSDSEQIPINVNMEDDETFSTYGAGLLQILEHETADTDSVVPNVSFGSYSPPLLPAYQESQTESHSLPGYNQLPSIDSFITDQPFPDHMLLEQDWELFADEGKEPKGKVDELFDMSGDDAENDDPFFYEGIYTELTRLGSYS